MNTLQVTVTFLSIGLVSLVFVLLRRDHLYLRHGLFWVLFAAACLLLGLWPGTIDQVAIWLGISYPPAGFLIGALTVLVIKYLHADMIQSRLERQVRRLNQRIAMFEITQTPTPATEPSLVSGQN
jgi:hypothetical protein